MFGALPSRQRSEIVAGDTAILAIEGTHRRGLVSITGGGAGRYRYRNPPQLIGGQPDSLRRDVLFKIGAALGAGDRHDIVALGQYPGVGADQTSDAGILGRSNALYANYRLKRVYYSAFSPIPDASRMLPLIRPPLLREHRLYQADWLMRFYGFAVSEITGVTEGGMLDLAIDPKLAWALAEREHFPVAVNLAQKEMLLRVPGFGVKTVRRP